MLNSGESYSNILNLTGVPTDRGQAKAGIVDLDPESKQESLSEFINLSIKDGTDEGQSKLAMLMVDIVKGGGYVGGFVSTENSFHSAAIPFFREAGLSLFANERIVEVAALDGETLGLVSINSVGTSGDIVRSLLDAGYLTGEVGHYDSRLSREDKGRITVTLSGYPQIGVEIRLLKQR